MTAMRALPRRWRGALDWVAHQIEQDAADWRIPNPVAYGLFVLPVGIAAVMALTVLYRPLFTALIEEDHPVEWLQFGLVLGTAAVAFGIAARLLSLHQRAFGLLYLVAGVAAIVIAGEEISWGQRILGWPTPDELAVLNRQGETTLHNVGDALGIFNLVMMLGALLAVVLPVAWRRGDPDRRRTLRDALFVPPFFVATGFLLAFGYRLVRLTLLPDPAFVVTHYGEVAELTFYFSLFAFTWLVFRRLTQEERARASRGARIGAEGEEVRTVVGIAQDHPPSS